MDGIEDALVIGLSVSNLTNESPLVSSTCGSYEGPHDGGLSGTIDEEGGMGADLRGISIAGGDVLILDTNTNDRTTYKVPPDICSQWVSDSDIELPPFQFEYPDSNHFHGALAYPTAIVVSHRYPAIDPLDKYLDLNPHWD